MDQVEASGKTVDDALNRACAELGADKNEVEFVVLDEGRKGGLFGRGGREARIRVTRLDHPLPAGGGQPADTRIPRGRTAAGGPARSAPDRGGGRGGGRSAGGGAPRRGREFSSLEAPAPSLSEADFLRPRGRDGNGQERPQPERARPRDAERPPRDDSERPRDRDRERRKREEAPRVEPDINAPEVELAAEVTDDILRLLDISASITIREPLTPGDGEGSVRAVLDISGEDLGLLIGRRGDTLQSLQYIVNLIITRRFPESPGITIDVEHYRHRREEQLTALTRRMAEHVRESGNAITLEPMSPAERRLVHLILAEDPELSTNSIGEGDNRKVVISARR